MSEYDRQQRQVDTLLIRGVVFSVFWICGFGSLFAIFSAWKARQIIRQSQGQVKGMRKVWWCFIVGGFGVAFWLIPLGTAILKG